MDSKLIAPPATTSTTEKDVEELTCPPATRTNPDGNTVALTSRRICSLIAVGINELLNGLKSDVFRSSKSLPNVSVPVRYLESVRW